MTDTAALGPVEPLAPVPSRSAAFRAAGRHTSRVRLLRRLIVAGTVLGVAGSLGVAFLNPFHIAIPNVTIDGAGINGTQVTMEHPKLSGFKSDGRPYTLNARVAVQDARTPSQLELHDIEANLTMADQSVIHVTSSLGSYDSSKQSMIFDHDVHMTSDNGLDAHLKHTYIEFKTGFVNTDDPVDVVMSTGTVSAESLYITDSGDKGKVAIFQGHVHSVMLPPSTGAATAKTLKGTTP